MRVIFLLSLPQFMCQSNRYGGYQLSCLGVDCSSLHHAHSCCSAHSQARGRSLQPLANWKFGSVFRNSIPPTRPYKVPSFEDIFETDHSSKSEQKPESQQQVVLNLNNPSGGQGQGQSPNTRPENLFKFSNVLSEFSRNSFTNKATSDALSKLSKKDYLHEAFFETTTKPYIRMTSTTQSYGEIRQQKLLEMAREELRKKQLRKDQFIKAQQKRDNYLKIIQQHTATEKPLVKESRSQELDSFFSKVKGFNNNKNAQKKLNHELIKRYHEKLRMKTSQDKQYTKKLQKWQSDKEVTKDDARVSLISGQNFVDMSGGTVIMDQKMSQSPSRSNQPALHVTQRPETTRPPKTTTTSTPSSAATNRRQDSDVDNEIDDERRSETKTRPGAGSGQFSREMCAQLRVPCRFVTEHPCCKMPQDIGMLGRPRAMDGSADLKWRLYQSRRGTSGSGRGRNLPGFSGGYNSKIPYNSWSSATDIRVPRYFYDGGPDLTSTILTQCWRLVYLNCLKDRDHPCCGLTNRREPLANNVIDRWLTRY